MTPEERLNVLKDRLIDRAPKNGVGCFLCGWILQDLQKNGRLTDHPGKNIDGSVLFPQGSKVLHLMLEELWHPEISPIAGGPA